MDFIYLFIWHARFLASDEGVFGLGHCIMLLGWF
jgi:hypothetical protein